jgi:hypothetical protein
MKADRAGDQRDEPDPAGRVGLTGLGGAGVLVAVAAIGALLDGLTGSGPGLFLQVSVVGGAVLATMSIASRLMWLLVPLPPLVFAVVAVVAGITTDHTTARSTTRLATAAATWIGDGFVAMTSATLLVIVIVFVRTASRRP